MLSFTVTNDSSDNRQLEHKPDQWNVLFQLECF